jgi:hypothetical protein
MIPQATAEGTVAASKGSIFPHPSEFDRIAGVRRLSEGGPAAAHKSTISRLSNRLFPQ